MEGVAFYSFQKKKILLPSVYSISKIVLLALARMNLDQP